jgi:8-oxo-dGTP diphosphatase
VLVIDWVPPHSVWDDMIAFIFHAGTLTPAEIDSIRLDDGELDGFAFFDDEEAAARLRPRARQRMTAAAAAARVGATVYLQDGQPWAPAVAKV